MFSRYQTGPWITIGFYVLMLSIFALGSYDAVWHHRWNGLVPAATALVLLFSFHKRFYES